MRSDEILLLDMLLAAQEAVDFLSGTTWETFQADRMRQMAVIKAIEVVGEAASRVSPEFRAAHPQLPWPQIVGMRHQLVHGYFEINWQRVWQTVQEDLPALIELLRPLVPPEEA